MTEDRSAPEDQPEQDEPAPPAVPAGAGELIRDALVDDDDPRFPLWLPLPGIAAAAGWAFYDASAGGGAFLETLIWPGAGIFVGTTLASWLGWQLDID